MGCGLGTLAFALGVVGDVVVGRGDGNGKDAEEGRVSVLVVLKAADPMKAEREVGTGAGPVVSFSHFQEVFVGAVEGEESRLVEEERRADPTKAEREVGT